jgi:carbon-monoxide dehydrogenase medium subunit
MKPTPFNYHDPRSLPDALERLATLENAKVLAGGQSLMAMMNLRYAQFDHLIDVNGVPGLSGITVERDRIRIGAMTRQARMLADRDLAQAAPIAADAIRYVGHIPTRNRGTIGGSLCHLDPSAELVGMTALHDGVLTVESTQGTRRIALADFAVGYMSTSIAPEELVTEVEWRRWPAAHGSSFQEFAQRHGDFAIVGAGALLTLRADRATIAEAAIVLIGVDVAPVRLTAAELQLTGETLRREVLDEVGEDAAAAVQLGDAAASIDYRRRLARVLSRRVLLGAAESARRNMEAVAYA